MSPSRSPHLPARSVASRRLWLAALAALLLLAALVAPTAPTFAAQAVDEVHYTFTSKTSVSIDWRGDANDVQWGGTSSYGNTAQGVAPKWTPWSSPGPFWQLELTGLNPGSTYHYSIGGGPDYTFHTPPTGSFRFDAIGDIGDTTSFSKLGATLSGIASDDPSFVLMVGDLTYANAAGASISVVDQHFNDIMNSWGTTAAYIPAWGNHEYETGSADDLRNYKGRLQMPNAQASPGSPAISCCGDDWGWFDAGPVRFIAYPEPWSGALADWQSKANTLMAQAQNDSSIKYIITYGHRPAYSTGYHPGEAGLANILDGFGSSYSKYVLNINGHSHDYERFQPIQGVTHVTVGSPSSVETPWSSTDPRTAYRAMHLAHLRVNVSDTGLRLQAVCDASVSKEDMTCNQGSVIDEYTIGTPTPTPTRTEYYVDKTMSSCSDTGPGTTATPFCTITKGVARLQAGYTLYVGDGTYSEQIKPLVSGTDGNPITITAWPGKSPTIGSGATYGAYVSTRSYIVVSNLTFSGSVSDGIYVTKSDHITVTGNTVTGAGRPAQSQTAPGISIRATNASVVSGNTSDRNNGHGIYVTNGSSGNTISDNEASFNAEGWQRNANGIDVTGPGNTVLRNVTHDNEDSGIQFFTGGDNGLAALNVTYNNGDHGIDDLNVTGGRLVGNTVYHNCTSGINVEGTSGNYTIVNNVSVDNAVYPAYNGISCSRRAGNIGVWDSAPPTTTVDHNLVYLSKPGTMYVFKSAYTTLAAMQTATGQEANGVQGDPKFAGQGSGDLRLTELSPAIDRGDSGTPGEQDRDILGHGRVRDANVDNSHATGPRAFDDLGAYEFQP
jgi:parallel beta-helix repeat protein